MTIAALGADIGEPSNPASPGHSANPEPRAADDRGARLDGARRTADLPPVTKE